MKTSSAELLLAKKVTKLQRNLTAMQKLQPNLYSELYKHLDEISFHVISKSCINGTISFFFWTTMYITKLSKIAIYWPVLQNSQGYTVDSLIYHLESKTYCLHVALFSVSVLPIPPVHQTYTHPFNGPMSGTTQVSQYQKGKTNLDFTGARDSE